MSNYECAMRDRLVKLLTDHIDKADLPGYLTAAKRLAAYLIDNGVTVAVDGNRQFREALLAVGRKNGKSLLVTDIIACALITGGEIPDDWCVQCVLSWLRQSVEGEP